MMPITIPAMAPPLSFFRSDSDEVLFALLCVDAEDDDDDEEDGDGDGDGDGVSALHGVRGNPHRLLPIKLLPLVLL